MTGRFSGGASATTTTLDPDQRARSGQRVAGAELGELAIGIMVPINGEYMMPTTSPSRNESMRF